MLRRFLSRLGRRLAPAAPLRHVHSEAGFRALLRRECARADRTNREFSLVVLAPPPGARRRVLALLDRRLRETDDLGRLEQGAVGALLADTPREGARALAAALLDALAERGIAPLSHAVHTYPGDWISAADAEPSPRAEPEHAGAEARDQAACAADAEPPCLAPYPAWKRAMDVAGALIAILLLSPILLAVALAVRLSSPGPVLFRQERVGWRGRSFRMLKFRSMHVNGGDEAHARFLAALVAGEAGGEGGGFKLRNDPRVTPVGRVIRRWSLDELPQLFNVLLGDMSLVGPRPEPPYAQAGYARWYHRRVHGAKPGITGLWQVRGRSRVTYETMVRMDLRYSQRISPFTDALLLLETVRAVVSAEGAY